MKDSLKISCFFIIALLIVSSSKLVAQDSMKVIEKYSLFSEYHKNKDYKSALPYGWEVLQMNPQFNKKWTYDKMEESLWDLHDSSDLAEEEIKAIEDTIIYFYDLAMQNYPEQKPYFQVRKAFVMETWLDADSDSVIQAYEEAMKLNPDVLPYYQHRLGQLYKANMEGNEEYKSKALDLYSALAEKEPGNPQWNTELESLVDNIDELVVLAKKAWDLDKDNLQKAWKYASLALKANSFEEALVPLEYLVEKSPETINYWVRLAEVYQKTDRLDQAEAGYKKLIQLEPDNKNHPFNLGILYMSKGQYSASRTQFQKASEVGGNWGLPIYYEGRLYEDAARGCEFNLETKMVYQLAVDTYRRAKNMDPSVAGEAQNRINALSSSVPTQEDWFFKKYKSGQVVPITGSCYGWIGKSITVP